MPNLTEAESLARAPGVPIRIIFTGDAPVPAARIAHILSEIDNEAFLIDADELEEFGRTVSTLTDNKGALSIGVDAAWHRFQSRGASLRVTEAARGSLILAGLAAGAAYWILQNTLGASFKDAWKETRGNNKAKEALKWDVGAATEKLLERLRYRLGRPQFVPPRGISRAFRHPDNFSVRVERNETAGIDVFVFEDGDGR